MTFYDSALLTLFYLGIGNAWVCHLYSRLSPGEQAYVGVPVLLLVAGLWPWALLHLLCRARR